jgi:AP-1 complex subunit gamma-1
VLTLSEHFVREEYISQLITVIATTPQLHRQVIPKVYFAMRDNTSQMGIA